MASRPPPSLRPSFNVGARLMEREVISLLDDDELGERKSASTARRSRPSLPVQGRRVSISSDDEVIPLDGPPPAKKGRFISSFVPVVPSQGRPILRAQRPTVLHSAPHLPVLRNHVPGHVDAKVLRPGDTADFALAVDKPSHSNPRAVPAASIVPQPRRIVIDLMDIDSDDNSSVSDLRRVQVSSSSSDSRGPTRSQPQYQPNAVAGPSRLPSPPPLLPPQQPSRRIRPPFDPLETLQTELILSNFPSFPSSQITEVLSLSWSFHPSSSSLALSSLTPFAQNAVTRSVLRSFLRHNMTRYDEQLEEMNREVGKRWPGGGRELEAAEGWRRREYAKLRRQANREADGLMREFERGLGDSVDVGVRRDEVWINEDLVDEHEEEEEWDREEWRD
ncbi:hypothetical protein BDY24DRAFT_442832 [Mrakia frigida]|uniref:uncharacterized protein n=1 Tax=Mrakia frigida TaxID=29902 RepID=UPI003FCBF427